MKRFVNLLILIAAISLCLTACGDKAEKNGADKTSEATQSADQAASGTEEATGDSLAALRDTYVASAEELLTRVGNQLPTYKEKAAALAGPVKTGAENAIKSLESAHNAAKEKLSEVKSADPANWQVLKPDMDKALGDLSNTFDKVKSMF